MSLLFESIELLDGRFNLLKLHNERFIESRKKIFGCNEEISLQDYLPTDIPATGKWKCRVFYNEQITNTDITIYQPRQIITFKFSEAGDFEYPYKYADRTVFDNLLAASGADEIIIIKNGYVTDTSYSNLVFFDGTSWITPASPLLPGVRRKALLQKGQIRTGEITLESIRHFKKFALINALNELGEAIYPIEVIID